MSRADELRAAFDRGFAEAPAVVAGAGYELLRIELGGEPYVVPLADVMSLHVDLRIVAVPATVPTLLGVIALRGAIVAVYDLRALLGLATTRAPRWIVLANGAGFAFDGFAGHVRVDDVVVRGVVELAGRLHPIVDLKGLLHA
ncbi:MAG: chemotaxis protein CheW [Kofleriaceae bacterium]